MDLRAHMPTPWGNIIMLLIKLFRIGPVTGSRLAYWTEAEDFYQLTVKSPYRPISSASTLSIPSPFLAPMDDILFKDADMIFACLFTISLYRLNRRHCFCFNTFNAARDLAREF